MIDCQVGEIQTWSLNNMEAGMRGGGGGVKGGEEGGSSARGTCRHTLSSPEKIKG